VSSLKDIDTLDHTYSDDDNNIFADDESEDSIVDGDDYVNDCASVTNDSFEVNEVKEEVEENEEQEERCFKLRKIEHINFEILINGNVGVNTNYNGDITKNETNF
jgi:hypothetical protein